MKLLNLSIASTVLTIVGPGEDFKVNAEVRKTACEKAVATAHICLRNRDDGMAECASIFVWDYDACVAQVERRFIECSINCERYWQACLSKPLSVGNTDPWYE